MSASKTYVLHVVTGLGRGGAETSLLRTLTHADADRFTHSVVSLSVGGELAAAIRDTGAEVVELGIPQGIRAFFSLPLMRNVIKARRPDVVQTWMYHSDLLGGLAARMAGSPPVSWGLHHANLDPKFNKRSTLWVARACARLSGSLPSAIVCCSEATRGVHAGFGYRADIMKVIPNGYEVGDFRRDDAAGAGVRAELGIGLAENVVGLVGRYHPLKDHRNFLAAARLLLDSGRKARFVLCGYGVDDANAELVALVAEFGLQDVTHLLGERDDPQRVMNSFDVGALSSVGEAFPNVICEMMLCELPCVVTDVGDAALITGDVGRVVPPGDAAALAREWTEILGLSAADRHSLGETARRRIVDNYAAEVISGRYHRVWSDLAGS